MSTRWDRKFFESTRGRVVTLLRRAGFTVDELARKLDLTNNGVRAHLTVLERDNIVWQRGSVRRSSGGVWRRERSVEFSSREFALLEYFVRHPRQVLSRQQILSAVWDYAFDPGSNVVDVYVSYLRNKLDRRGEPSLIDTVRGAGYRFEPPEQD